MKWFVIFGPPNVWINLAKIVSIKEMQGPDGKEGLVTMVTGETFRIDGEKSRALPKPYGDRKETNWERFVRLQSE